MDTIKKYYFIILSLFPLLEFIFSYFVNRSFIIVYGAFGSLLFFFYLFSGSKLKYPKYLIPLILLFFYYFGWDIVNDEISTYKSGFFSYIYSNFWLHTITILILIENTRFDESFIKTILNIFKVTIVVAFLVTLIQLFVNPFFLMPEYLIREWSRFSQYQIRLNSIFGYLSPTELGNSFVPIVSILIGYFLFKRNQLSPIWLIMAGIIVFANKSRYLYLIFLIILIQYPIIRGIDLKKIFRTGFVILISLIVLVFLMQSIGFNFMEFIEERLLSSSAATRLLAFELLADFFPENPFFGSGVHVSEELARAIGGRSSQMHVGYASHLYEYGLIGSIMLFSFWYFITQKFYDNARRTQYYGSLFAFVTLLVANLTGVIYSLYFYGLLFAFIFDKYVIDQVSQEDFYELK